MPSRSIILVCDLLPCAAAPDELSCPGNQRDRWVRHAECILADFGAVDFFRVVALPGSNCGRRIAGLLVMADYSGDRACLLPLIFHALGGDLFWRSYWPGQPAFQEWAIGQIQPSTAAFVAFPETTAKELRARVQALDLNAGKPPVDHSPGFLRNGVQPIWRVFCALPALTRFVWRHGWRTSLWAAQEINRSLDRVWWIRLFNRLTVNTRLPANRPADVVGGAVRPRPVLVPEDTGVQNPLTLFTVVREEYRDRLKAVLGLIDLYAKHLSADGRLLDMCSIHTAHWILLDDGRYLLFGSNYDGSWDSYIDEFSDLIGSGLDAIWGSGDGYPGSRDVSRLKLFLASAECPVAFYYSGYPDASLFNLSQSA